MRIVAAIILFICSQPHSRKVQNNCCIDTLNYITLQRGRPMGAELVKPFNVIEKIVYSDAAYILETALQATSSV